MSDQDLIRNLTQQNDDLRALLSDRLVNTLALTEFCIGDGGLDLGLEGGAAEVLAELLAKQFQEGGGINYLELAFQSQVVYPNDRFLVTVQKVTGKTAHELRREAEADRDKYATALRHIADYGFASKAGRFAQAILSGESVPDARIIAQEGTDGAKPGLPGANAAVVLARHNAWRRGDASVLPDDPKVIGQAIDDVLTELSRNRAVLLRMVDSVAEWNLAARETLGAEMPNSHA